MTALTGNMTLETAAVYEVLFAKLAAPGMCNPDDDEPCTTGTPTQAQIDHDHRSLAQRHHDALLVIGRIALMSGDLGQLNGLPVSVIIRTTLQDFESRAGIGISGGGTKIPIQDVIRMGGARPSSFGGLRSGHRGGVELFPGPAHRQPGPADHVDRPRRGAAPNRAAPSGAYGSQVHHAVADWADGGHTNVDEMTLACGPDNRMVHADGGYTTTINPDGNVEWHPPPGLDHGQHRINYHHRPELLLTPPPRTPNPSWSQTSHRPRTSPPTDHPGCEPAPSPGSGTRLGPST